MPTIGYGFPQIFTLFPYMSDGTLKGTIRKRGTASMTTKHDRIRYRLERRQMYSKRAAKNPFLHLSTLSTHTTQYKVQRE